jgi:hypothetical protein
MTELMRVLNDVQKGQYVRTMVTQNKEVKEKDVKKKPVKAVKGSKDEKESSDGKRFYLYCIFILYFVL